MSRYILCFEESEERSTPRGSIPRTFPYAIRRLSDRSLVFRADSARFGTELMANLDEAHRKHKSAALPSNGCGLEDSLIAQIRRDRGRTTASKQAGEGCT